jgi:methionyl-tRNA formyltransferase
MNTHDYSCALLTLDHEHLAHSAEEFARSAFDVRFAIRHGRNQKSLSPELNQLLSQQPVDFLFNFLSPVILPEELLAKVKRAAINFHPAPPEWPGIGSASFAIFENAADFGVTAHLMTGQVDAGPIVRVIRFPIMRVETCEQLFSRSLNYSLILFYELLAVVAGNGLVEPSGESWQRKAITRKQFEKWMTLSPDDSPDLIRRKERAVRHSRFSGPFIEVAGLRFEMPPRKDS